MAFLEPLWLILIPVVIGMALWRGKAVHRVVVADWELYQRAMQRMSRAVRGRSRFESTWRLVPPILLVLAMAQPEWTSPREAVILLDRSAGGGSLAAEGTRIERALAKARKALPSALVMGVPPSSNPAALTQPSGITNSTRDLIDAAATLVAAGRTVAVATWRRGDWPKELGVYVVTDSNPNSGIVATSLGDDGSLWVRIAGRTGILRRRLVAYGTTGEVLVTSEVDSESSFKVTIREPVARDVRELRLEPADSDPSDDVVLLRPADSVLRIGVAAGVSTDVVRALRSIPRADVLETTDRTVDMAVGYQGDRVSLLMRPSEWPPDLGRVVAQRVGIGVSGQGALGLLNDPVASVGLIWSPEAAPPDFTVAATAGTEPLLLRRGSQWVLLAESSSGDWAKRAIFPRVIAAIAATAGSGARVMVTRCGEVVEIPTASGQGVRIEADGSRSSLSAVGNVFHLTASTPGLVRVEHDGVLSEASFAVLSEAASLSQAGDEVAKDPAPVVIQGRVSLSGFLFWFAAAIAVWLACRHT